MPLTRSSSYRPSTGGVELTDEERKAQERQRRQFALALEDMADDNDPVMVTVLKDLGEKSFNGNDPVQGYLIRFVALAGSHKGLVNDELPMYKAGFRSRLQQAGVGATLVARLGRYGTRNAIGLEDENEGDVELAEKALADLGDPFAEAGAGNGNGASAKTSLTEGAGDARKAGREKAAAEKDMVEPPF